MNYKRISPDQVADIIAQNRDMGEKSLRAYAAVGIAGGPMPMPSPDPEKPWTVRFREQHEKNKDPEEGWCLHPKFRFRSAQTAAMLAKDLLKADPRLEAQIVNTCEPSIKSPLAKA